jgi:cell division protein ZapA (FtsZ GTPase activity inhibitor)
MQVQITIRGRQYTVRGDDVGDDLGAIAADLDRRLADVAARTRSFDAYTVALLTALNLASELHRTRSQVAHRVGELDREVASIVAMVEAALPEADAT